MRPEMSLLLAAIAFIETKLLPHNEEFTLTSVTDGKHGETSLHYAGFAVDIDHHDPGSFPWIREKLVDRLTVEFDVVVEATHIHIEFQPKRSHREAEVAHAWI